jgi:hypothetical protein
MSRLEDRVRELGAGSMTVLPILKSDYLTNSPSLWRLLAIMLALVLFPILAEFLYRHLPRRK